MAFDNLTEPLPYRARRESSYDRSGGNADSMPIEKGACGELCSIRAAGEIRHIWMAVGSEDPYHLRRVLIRMYWDDETTPSVECPVGDFFGLGHSRAFSYTCAAFSTTVNDAARQGEGVALNCWLPMPFSRAARIELVNETELPLCVYYYIDWRELAKETVAPFTLHANWRRENPAVSAAQADDPLYDEMKNGRNLTDKYNYLFLYAEGRGNFLGVNLSVDNLQGEWWGEGDDMFFIDRAEGSRECGGAWPPDLHGTGSEDYFCHAWGMQRAQGPYCGESWCEDNNFLRAHNVNGKVCLYRYHIPDPVPFTRRIRVSMEHGHANDRADDWASTAYWYQAEPHSPLSYDKMPPPDERLPRPAKGGRRLATYMN